MPSSSPVPQSLLMPPVLSPSSSYSSVLPSSPSVSSVAAQGGSANIRSLSAPFAIPSQTPPSSNRQAPSAQQQYGQSSNSSLSSASLSRPQAQASSSSQAHLHSVAQLINDPLRASSSSAVSSSSSSSTSTAGFDLNGAEDRVFQAGQDFNASSEMDINVRKGDRIKMVTLMDGNMVLGCNLETDATGTFPFSCITSGKVLTRAEEEKRAAVSAEVAAVVEVVEAAAAADVALVLEDGTMLMDEVDWPGSTPVSNPSVVSRDSTFNQTVSSVPSSNKSYAVGLHIVTKSYDSKSVLEASLEVNDLVHVMFWQDDEIALGVHLRTQTESLFQGSLLQYIGDVGEAQSTGSGGNAEYYSGSTYASSTSRDRSMSNSSNDYTHPYQQSANPPLPAAIAQQRRRMSNTNNVPIPSSIPPPLSVVLASSPGRVGPQRLVSGTWDDGDDGDDDGDNVDEALFSTGMVVDSSNSWFASAVAFQRDDAAKYNQYLERLEDNVDPGARAGKVSYNFSGPQQQPVKPYAPPRTSSVWVKPGPGPSMSSQQGLAAIGQLQQLQPQLVGAGPSSFVGPTSGRTPTSGFAQGEEVPRTQEEKRALAAKCVIDEFHATEETFLTQLKIYKQYVIEPIREAKLLTDMDFDIAFKRCDPILALSTKVESYLRDAKSRDPTAVVELFLNNIEHEEWKVYEDYIRFYRSGKQVIATVESQQGPEGDAFRQFLRQLEREEIVTRKTIYDFMMLPIQRITRYWLLLERLRKYAEPHSLLYENIQIAEEYMKEVGNTLQRIQEKEDGIRAMFQIVNTVENCPINILSYSKRHFEGEFNAKDLNGYRAGLGLAKADGFVGISPFVDTAPGPRRLFLFSDCILVAAFRTKKRNKAPPDSKKLELVQRLNSKDIRILDSPDGDDKLLRIRCSFGGKGEEVFNFRMADVKSRTTLVKAIEGSGLSTATAPQATPAPSGSVGQLVGPSGGPGGGGNPMVALAPTPVSIG
ncbi:hypothetical protein DFJ73DRAFT_173634 [Zopfochytrium polystomum]|nr:hypothetical protein DFJ73DRAFT_173634 [Zopfochytrium polystomum]